MTTIISEGIYLQLNSQIIPTHGYPKEYELTAQISKNKRNKIRKWELSETAESVEFKIPSDIDNIRERKENKQF